MARTKRKRGGGFGLRQARRLRFHAIPALKALGRTILPLGASPRRRTFSPNCWSLRSSSGIEPVYSPDNGSEARRQPRGDPRPRPVLGLSGCPVGARLIAEDADTLALRSSLFSHKALKADYPYAKFSARASSPIRRKNRMRTNEGETQRRGGAKGAKGRMDAIRARFPLSAVRDRAFANPSSNRK